MSKRVIGLDYGKQRIGVAISDPLGSFAQPLTVLDGYSLSRLIEYLKQAHNQYEFKVIVMGLTLRTQGNNNPEAEAVKAIASQIESAVGITIAFEDERYQHHCPSGPKSPRQKL